MRIPRRAFGAWQSEIDWGFHTTLAGDGLRIPWRGCRVSPRGVSLEVSFGSCWLKCWTPPEQRNQSSSGPYSGKILVGVWTLVLQILLCIYFSIANSTLVLPRLTQIPSTCSSIANSTLVLPRPVFLVTPPKNSWTLKTIPKTVTLKRISASCGQPLCANVCPYFFVKKLS